MVDFTKAKIGQEVWCPEYGNGKITGILDKDLYPVTVRFYNYSYPLSFTKEGFRLKEVPLPTLCLGSREPLDQGELPKPEPKPLAFNGVPVWAMVSNSDDYNYAIKRRVIAYDNSKYLAISEGLSSEESIATIAWSNAWEIENE